MRTKQEKELIGILLMVLIGIVACGAVLAVIMFVSKPDFDAIANDFAKSKGETLISHTRNNGQLYIKTDAGVYECATLTTVICFKVNE